MSEIFNLFAQIMPELTGLRSMVEFLDVLFLNLIAAWLLVT